MDEKIRDLYQSTYQISYDFLIEQKRDNIEKVRKIIPQIQEFCIVVYEW